MNISFRYMVLAFLISGCSVTPKSDYCLLLPGQRAIVTENIRKAIEAISNEDVTYHMPSLLIKDSKLYKGKGGCWAYLLPKSRKEGYHILHGEGGIYVDMETLETGETFWFRY